jgi:hypothetical protein
MALASWICIAALIAPIRAPAAVAFEPAPLPTLEESEYTRSSFELVSSVGAGVPEQRPGGEAALPAGSELGLLGLYRAHPYFAAGVGLRWNTFPALPSSERAPSEAGGSALFAGAFGRVYFLERGAHDPYFELGLGLSSLRTSRGAGALRTRDTAELLATARAAIGVDFSLGRRVRLGPSFGYTRYAAGAAERCTQLGCASFPLDEADLPASVLSVALSLTFAAGDPL